MWPCTWRPCSVQRPIVVMFPGDMWRMCGDRPDRSKLQPVGHLKHVALIVQLKLQNARRCMSHALSRMHAAMMVITVKCFIRNYA